MNKQEIQQQIKEARERHSAELKALEAKLNEPEKWEPKGGDWCALVGLDGDVVTMPGKLAGIKNNFIWGCSRQDEARDLAAHLKRQAILWQLANDLNNGWKPDWENGIFDKWYLYFDHTANYWDCSNNRSLESAPVHFKDEKTAEKACEILNNQPELMQ